ncbi:hypothetical protein [Pantoea vagans]|uniref:hypothetical protein n=1 Tax=Pantoea vagans TaxID=470934 RepID=UPI003FA368FE
MLVQPENSDDKPTGLFGLVSVACGRREGVLRSSQKSPLVTGLFANHGGNTSELSFGQRNGFEIITARQY